MAKIFDCVKPDRYNGKPREMYNCGGLALSTYDWLAPFYTDRDEPYDGINEDMSNYTDDNRDMLIEELIDANFAQKDVVDTILHYDVKFLIKHHPYLKIISGDEVAKTNKRVIAYRIFITFTDTSFVLDQDFHFRVRVNGFWFEKCGRHQTQLAKSDVYAPWGSDDLIYDSDIVFFEDTRF